MGTMWKDGSIYLADFHYFILLVFLKYSSQILFSKAIISGRQNVVICIYLGHLETDFVKFQYQHSIKFVEDESQIYKRTSES